MDFVLSEMIDKVMTARASQRPIFIKGGGTKDFYGEPALQTGNGVLLDMSTFAGVVNYEPSELVLTARAGTLLSDIEALLAEKRQMLAFEPPRFGPASTIGGCVSAGLSGPRRMAAGPLRDFVLGTTLLDANGTILRFGGEVMKNVAGYDISRLLAGAMGIFGPLLEVSIKVAPMPLVEETRVLSVTKSEALDLFKAWRSRPLPVSATAWEEEHGVPVLRVRLSGSSPAIESARRHIGGERMDDEASQAYWASLRDQTHPFFQARTLWRLALPPTTPALGLGSILLEWNGGQRWFADGEHSVEADFVRKAAERHGGHATLYRHDGTKTTSVFHPVAPGVKAISRRLKQELDPTGMFNPGRLFCEF